jgi:hypothetical protein
MGFKKDFIIYEKGETKVYINQCHNPGKKTRLFTIRRDDDREYGYLLGVIKFDGGWKQYLTFFEPDTKWSAGCKKKIAEFEEIINKKWRDEHLKNDKHTWA